MRVRGVAHSDESWTKKVCQQKSVSKVMLVAFFNCWRIVYQQVCPPKTRVSKENYKIVLERFPYYVWQKQQEVLRWWILHQCTTAHECFCASVAWAPQHWSDASTVQPRHCTVWFLVVSITETWTVWLEYRNRSPDDPGNLDDLWTHFEGGVWKDH